MDSTLATVLRDSAGHMLLVPYRALGVMALLALAFWAWHLRRKGY